MNKEEKESIDNKISEMLEYTAILTDEIIKEAKNYTPEPVLSEKQHGGIVQGWTEWINKGFIATFEKRL